MTNRTSIGKVLNSCNGMTDHICSCCKYNKCTYKTGTSCGGSNMHFKLILCKYRIYVASILKFMYKIKGYTYLLPSKIGSNENNNFKYVMLVRHQNHRPKEVNNGSPNQRIKGQNMVNYKLW